MSLGKVGIIVAGGGSRGIIQLGMLKFLRDLGVKPDIWISGSVGVLNSLLYLLGKLEELEALWMNIQNKDVYKPRLLSLWKLFTDDGSLNDSSPLRVLIEKHVDAEAIAKLDFPFIVNVTNLSTMQPEAKDLRGLSKEEIVSWILASASPPILFPSVTANAYQLVDCGISNNYGLVQAVNEGCDTVICLTPTNYQPKKIKNLIDVIQATISTASFGYLEREARAIEKINKVIEAANVELVHDLKKVNLIIVRPRQPWDQGLIDFNYKVDRAGLIQFGYNIAREALKDLEI